MTNLTTMAKKIFQKAAFLMVWPAAGFVTCYSVLSIFFVAMR